jgi:radical SAM protein with 4Fe4S-binding SPASM domain
MCELWKRPKAYREAGKTELSTDEMKRVIDDFAAIGTTGVGFTGGEPLLRNDILDLVTYARKKGLVTHMSSNGFMITEELAGRIMDSGLDAIGFSLDGATAATHDGIRGAAGSHAKVLEAISIFNNLNKRGSRRITIVVVTVVSTLNINEIVDLVDLLEKAGVDKVSFLPFHDIGILADGIPAMKEHRLQPDQLAQLDTLVDKLIEIKRTKKIIDSSERYLGLFKRCFRDMPLPIPCYAGYATFAIDGYGDMYTCFPMMEVGRGRDTVNVRDTPLKAYWTSAECQRLRDSLRDCRKCYWNNQTEISLLFKTGRIG